MSIKKFGLHWDAALAIALVFVMSLGFNLYQRQQYQSLLQELVDAKWERDNMEVNWTYVKGKLEKCQGTDADEPVPHS